MMMAKYRKKPVEIEAVQLRWDTWNEICDFVSPQFFGGGVYIKDGKPLTGGRISNTMGLKINTLEGVMLAVQDDFIIRGVNGEYYSCKPDIFEKTYEKVDGE
jgi:hypothetical protein